MTCFGTELWFDHYNCDSSEVIKSAELASNFIEWRREGFPVYKDENGVMVRRYDFSIIPDCGFLGDPEPLAKNIELKLRFDREPSSYGVLKILENKDEDSSFLSKPLVIKDCYSVLQYVASEQLRDQYETINSAPLIYEYDENEVIIKNLEQNVMNIRINSLHGGKKPSYMFAGIIETDALQGSSAMTSTGFKQHDVKEFNILINGHSVNGYPIQTPVGSSTYALAQWLETTDRLNNNHCGGSFNIRSFKDNFIWSHNFETAEPYEGWISVELKLEKVYTSNMSIVIWLITPCELAIDKYNRVEKLNQ